MENLNLIIAERFHPPKLKKDRKEYFMNYNNRSEVKEKRKLARLAKEKEKQEQENEVNSKYSKAENYKVLMTLKEYTDLSQEKRKKWLNFIWTFKDLNEIGFSDIIQIMKIREEAENLINDYWETAKNEVKKGKSWNNLSQEQQDRLIKYWAQEKARKEQKLTEALEKQKKQSKTYEKDLELAKFHEERGKVNCPCWKCEQTKQIQEEVKQELNKTFAEQDKENEIEWVNADCANCGEHKKVDTDSGLCKKCSAEQEGEEV